jgi:hypothetical protein
LESPGRREVVLAQPIHGLLRTGRQFLPWAVNRQGQSQTFFYLLRRP